MKQLQLVARPIAPQDIHTMATGDLFQLLYESAIEKNEYREDIVDVLQERGHKVEWREHYIHKYLSIWTPELQAA